MKKFKVRYIIIALLIVLIGAGAIVGVSVFRSPEYALLQISKDIKESGMDGLTPHLTGDAKAAVDSITAIAENNVVGAIISLFGGEDSTDSLMSNLKEIDWSLDDVLKGKDKADVRVGFNYKDEFAGTIDINMIREDGEWKISGVGNPSFDKVEFGK